VRLSEGCGTPLPLSALAPLAQRTWWALRAMYSDLGSKACRRNMRAASARADAAAGATNSSALLWVATVGEKVFFFSESEKEGPASAPAVLFADYS